MRNPVFHAFAATSVVLAMVAGLPAAEPAPRLQQAEAAIARHSKGDPKVQLIAATLLGGSGNEWLAGGGVAADGSVLVAGCTATIPDTIGGQVPVVFGTDGKAPKAITNAMEAHGTPFVAKLSADGSKVLKVARLPVGSGTITSAVVTPDGGICLVGLAGVNVQTVPELVDALPKADGEKADEDDSRQAVLIVKLSADLDRILWSRRANVSTRGPVVRLVGDDIDVRTRPALRLAQDGSLKTTWIVSLGQGHTWMTWEDPIARRHWVARNSAFGADWSTGNADWLRISGKDDGKTWTMLYCWGGAARSTDAMWPTDLSAIFDVGGDPQGKVWVVAQVDGPDSIMNRVPYDLRTRTGLTGLGLPITGVEIDRVQMHAGIRTTKNKHSPEHATNMIFRQWMPVAWLGRINPDTCQMEAATAWCGFDGETGLPRFTTIDRVAADQDTVVITGNCEDGNLPVTQGSLGKLKKRGNFLAIFNGALDQVRYATVLPGVAATLIRDISDMRNTRSALSISRMPDGRQMVLMVGGADRPAVTTPGCAQPTFAGGASDGYLTLLEVKP
ncbi:hypothetical protein LBMAG53_07890 [Planctomycetota bacterium]|nr:hypothetical protein LBMAG53_07890 [Planctomycetota bacterium]